VCDGFAGCWGIRHRPITKKQQHNAVQLSNEFLILQQIDAIRKFQPRCGGRKLFIMLQPFLKQHQICIGRDQLF